MHIASLLFLVACAASVTAAPAPKGEDTFFTGDVGGGGDPDVPQWGWFKGDTSQFDTHDLDADHGADQDDTYTAREKTSIQTYVEDRLSEAASFLADQSDSSFDFQEWYNSELEQFKYDLEDVDYNNMEDKQRDLDDFKDQLDQIATEFSYNQGEDYAAFVADTVSQAWDRATNDAADIVRRLRETGHDLNNLEQQEQDLYWKLLSIGCGDPHDAKDGYIPDKGNPEKDKDHLTRYELIDPSSDQNEKDFQDIDDCTKDDVSGMPISKECTYGETVTPDDPQCELSQIWYEILEANAELSGHDYNGQHATLARKQEVEDRQLQLKRDYSATVRDWRQLRRELDNVEQQTDHALKEIKRLNTLLTKILSLDNGDEGVLGGVPIYQGGEVANPDKLYGKFDENGDKVSGNWNDMYPHGPVPYDPKEMSGLGGAPTPIRTSPGAAVSSGDPAAPDAVSSGDPAAPDAVSSGDPAPGKQAEGP